MTRDHGILAGVAALVLLLSLATDTFLTPGNLVNLLDQTVVVGLLACGMTLCVICGVFDLSAGAVLAVSAIVAVVVTRHAGVPAGYAAAVAAGALLGTVNGLVVVWSGVHSFIVTLALGLVHRGLALVITGGAIVYPGPAQLASFQSLSWPTVLGGVTAASLLLVAAAVAGSVLLSRTTFGRRVYAVGGNSEAARLSGIGVRAVRVGVFAISGTCAALAGLVLAARGGSAQSDMGSCS